MNRFITLLLLGVVVVAMLLVFLVHMNGDTSSPPAPSVQSAPVAAVPPPTQPEAPAEQPAPETAPPAQAEAPTPEAPAPNAPAEAAPTQASAQAPAPMPTTVPPAQVQTPPAAPASAQAPAPAPSPAPAPQPPATQGQATASRSEGSGRILDISLHFRDQGMFLSIEGNGPLPAKYFILSQPERLVVDLPGSWKGLKSPVVPSNNVLKSARTGRYGNADRLVLDLVGPIKTHQLTRINDNKVEIYFAQ